MQLLQNISCRYNTVHVQCKDKDKEMMHYDGVAEMQQRLGRLHTQQHRSSGSEKKTEH